MSKLAWKKNNFRLIFLYLLFFLIFLWISEKSFPANGMWQLLEAQKLISGSVLYDDVRSVSPPGFYIEFLCFLYLGAKSLFFYKTLGVALISLVFVFFYKILESYLSNDLPLYVTFFAFLIYICTPWEIISTYTYISNIFAIISLHFYHKAKNLSYFLAGLSAAFKITIGGSLIIGYTLGCVIELLFNEKHKNKHFNFIFSILGFIVPFLILNLFKIKINYINFFVQSFSGESKGGFFLALINPIKFYWNHFLGIINFEFSEGLNGIFVITNKILNISTLSFILFSNAITLFIYYLYLTYKKYFNKEYKKITFLFPVVISSFGVIYASAMSSYLKTDDILIIIFFATLIYKYSEENKYFLLLLSVPFLFALSILTYKLAFANILFLTALTSIIVFLYVNWRQKILLILLISIILKLYSGPVAWWETNIRGKFAVNWTSLGFYATPFYSQLYDRLHKLRGFSEQNDIPLTIYSFPTSTLPYHIFGYQPPWRYVVHHADVFPSSEVNREFRIIENNKPSFMVISRWSELKERELDDAFSPGQFSSQHRMRILIDNLIQKNYTLCSYIAYDNYRDAYNFPIYFYINTDVVKKYTESYTHLCNNF